ncbi:MAG: vitamin K epoxide reductase family protein [bacterium]|nr:vitamin K epoxide reductase family protein [bacterium]
MHPHIIPYTIIAALAWAGFFVCVYIHSKKTKNQPMLCYVGADCDKVVHSQYSKFFGIPLEYLGMIYYALLGFSYPAVLLFPSLANPTFAFILFGLTVAAFLFSIYLIAIQAFALGEWCTWCLFSAGISTIIVTITLFNVEPSVIATISKLTSISLIFHLIGIALGVGAATISDIFFFKFLKDFKISQIESEILNTLSQVIWLGIGFLLLSGLGLFLPAAATYAVSAKFITKMIVVAILIANGIFLNYYISPRLLDISFGKEHDHKEGELRTFRKVAFASGAISLTSWYTALILGALHSIPLSAAQAFAIYVAALFVTISISQIVESRMAKHALLCLERKHSPHPDHDH